MKKLLIILLFVTAKSYGQFEFRNLHVEKFNTFTTRVLWTVWDESDVVGYTLERNGVDVCSFPSGDFLSAAYMYFDYSPRKISYYRVRIQLRDREEYSDYVMYSNDWCGWQSYWWLNF